MSETLWHQDFRGSLQQRFCKSRKDKSEEDEWYDEKTQFAFLCPDAEELLYARDQKDRRIIDYSNAHKTSREILNEILSSRQKSRKLKKIKLKDDPYYWMHKTNRRICLRPGLLNHRPDKPEAVELGDDIVHGIVAGRTGSGKSVLLNDLLVTAMDEYAPWELNLYLVDMKKVEFGAYMSKGQEAPHIKACAATGEVRYTVSLFSFIEHTMQCRQNLFTAVGCKKISEFRETFSRTIPELVLPRILVVVDEFQQLFLNAKGKEEYELNALINSITRLGRATGVHLLFASQEMSGTGMGQLMGNFKLRMALACSKDVSSEILGNPEAAELEKGHVLVNSDEGNVDKNRCYWVPFCDKPKEAGSSKEDDYLQGHLAFLREKAQTCGYLQSLVQKYYQEDLQYDISVFRTHILKKSMVPRKHVIGDGSTGYFEAFMLGDGVLYSPKPFDVESICIERDNARNILSICTSAEDRAYLENLFLLNIVNSPLSETHLIEIVYYDFDPEVRNIFRAEDLCSDSRSVTVSVKHEADIVKEIVDLELRKALFFFLDKRSGELQDTVTFYRQCTDAFFSSLEKCSDYSAKIEEYEITDKKKIRDDILEKLKGIETEEGLSSLVENYVFDGYSDDHSAGEAKSVEFGDSSWFFFDGSEEEAPAADAAENSGTEEADEIRSKSAGDQMLTFLKAYIACKNGIPIRKQYPVKYIFFSNLSLSSVLNIGNRRDIKELYERIMPYAAMMNVLFLCFTSDTEGNYRMELRSACDYFFVCSNNEKDYDFVNLRYTGRLPGNIVVDCKIKSKNVEKSFKKFRWLHALPKAESVDLSGIEDIYGENE